ncbi:replication protein [Pseudomonas arsenicoxydans]|uniref:Phage replication protein n=1 Tax=Pseudomonas arsenicoxydans TaxID=702115 RepID=A0A4P6G353_9PSED|nr:replication protein [Pseudomonas arsenicoxydans]QAY85377.1 phage replication protein [Pseudomonas arsenicoxydans]
MNNVIPLKITGGFTRMENKLIEALMVVDLPGRELKVALYVARATIGYQVAEARIQATEISKATNIHPDVASKAISHLLKRRVLYRVGGARGDIGISDPSEWVFYSTEKECPNQTISSDSDHSGRVVSIARQTKSDDSLLYTKKEPLVTVSTKQITAPQGAEPTQPEIKIEKPAALVSFDGEDFEVDATLITKWAEAYSPTDVEAEIKRAAAWASGSKPKKDWRRFLVNWLGREFKKNPSGASEAGVPVDKIIDLYHKVCPNLPAVTVTSDRVLRSMIAERWNESPAHQSGQGFWLPFFQKANNRNQVFFRGANVAPRLEALVSRAVFREVSEASQ